MIKSDFGRVEIKGTKAMVKYEFACTVKALRKHFTNEEIMEAVNLHEDDLEADAEAKRDTIMDDIIGKFGEFLEKYSEKYNMEEDEDDDDYSVGDRVRIRQWDDMVDEFGLDSSGDIKVPSVFTSEMKKLCGKTAVIVEKNKFLNRTAYKLTFDDKKSSDRHSFSKQMFEEGDK